MIVFPAPAALEGRRPAAMLGPGPRTREEARMPAYLTFHVEPERRWEDLVEKYRVLARETGA